MLTADRLEAARARHLRALPGAALLLARTRVPSPRGGFTDTWEPTLVARPSWAPTASWPQHLEDQGAMPARVAAPNRVELALARDRWGTDPAWVVTLPWSAPVEVGDRLQLTPDAGGEQLTVAVVGTYSAGGSWSTAERLACVEVPR